MPRGPRPYRLAVAVPPLAVALTVIHEATLRKTAEVAAPWYYFDTSVTGAAVSVVLVGLLVSPLLVVGTYALYDDLRPAIGFAAYLYGAVAIGAYVLLVPVSGQGAPVVLVTRSPTRPHVLLVLSLALGACVGLPALAWRALRGSCDSLSSTRSGSPAPEGVASPARRRAVATVLSGLALAAGSGVVFGRDPSVDGGYYGRNPHAEFDFEFDASTGTVTVRYREGGPVTADVAADLRVVTGEPGRDRGVRWPLPVAPGDETTVAASPGDPVFVILYPPSGSREVLGLFRVPEDG